MSKKNISKADLKHAKKIEKEAILNEKRKIEEKIDGKIAELKKTKDKGEKRELKKEIKDLKETRANIGKKDTYFSEIKAEMKMVRWPNKTELVKYSLACLIFVAFFALFFFGLDALFALVKDLIK